MSDPGLVSRWRSWAPYLLSILRVSAAFLFMQPFWPVLNQGMPAILFCFLWLYLSAAGPGPWSIDAMRHPESARSNVINRGGRHAGTS